MIRLVSLAIAACLGLGPALAADPAPAAPADALPAPQNLYIWTGPYAGAFVGYSRADFDAPAGGTVRGDGFIGGIYAGYNLQTDRIVYGVEGDAGLSGADGSASVGPDGAPLDVGGNAFGSIRARLGVTYDPILLFATGGIAVANNELIVPGASDSATHVGWTIGAGVEAALRDNVTSRVEYRYTDFNRRDYDLGNVTISSGYDEHSIRAGVALKF